MINLKEKAEKWGKMYLRFSNDQVCNKLLQSLNCRALHARACTVAFQFTRRLDGRQAFVFISLALPYQPNITDKALLKLLLTWNTWYQLCLWLRMKIDVKVRECDPTTRTATPRTSQKPVGLISKTTTSHVHHAFLYISFLFFHDYDVKMTNFAVKGGRKQATTKFYFSVWAWLWFLDIQLQEGSPTFDKVSG